MNWSPQQQQAIAAVKRWLEDPRAPQVFRLFGFAGTGKTTLAKHLADGVDGTVVYAAFTGKAALVLRSKGCEGASTIHSLIYKPVENEVTGHTEFIKNPDSVVGIASLCVIDEVSMVGEDLARDLLSFGTKVLVLGDPAQLPPVKGEGFFINATPDFMLTEVHRQAAENPIIRMSIDIREGRGLKPGRYGDSRVGLRREIDKDELRSLVLQADQVLCGVNKTRQAFNIRMRQLKGHVGKLEHWHPVENDKLICLRNDHGKGLLNGGLWRVNRSAYRKGQFDMLLTSLDIADALPVEVSVPQQFFLGTEKDMDWRELKRADQFTYGDTLTVHKSQGSQWNNVLLFDESFVFREDARKHLYTAITRAAEKVDVFV